MKNKKPEIRFKGFSEDWEEKMLADVAEKVSVGIATSSSKYFTNFEDGVPFIKNQDIKDGVIETKNLEAITHEFDEANKTKRIKTGDILTVRTGYPGLSAVVPEKLNNAQTFTTLITRLKADTVNPEFVTIFINSDLGMKQTNGMQAGGAQKNINANTLKNLLLNAPSILEQTQIGTFLSNLDSLITLHQRKYEKLGILKKAMLEKMFPKNGADVPEIRFKGFEGAWVEKKVLDVAPLQRGFDLPKSTMKKGNYPVVMSNGINGYHSEFKAKSPGVITGRSGTIGNVHYIESDYWPHNTALWVTDFKGNNPLYIYYMYKQLDLNRFGTGSGVPTLNRNDVHFADITIPSYEEQEKIGNYFKNLDKLLTLHQGELEKLKNLKKALLEKMFV